MSRVSFAVFGLVQEIFRNRSVSEKEIFQKVYILCLVFFEWCIKSSPRVILPIVLLQLSSHEELEVLSVLPEVSHIHGIQSFRLAPSTKITFIGRQYRFVFCLDISPSEATVVRFTSMHLNMSTKSSLLFEECFVYSPPCSNKTSQELQLSIEVRSL